MILKRPLLLSPTFCGTSLSNSQCSTTSSSRSTRHSPRPYRRKRCYATVVNESKSAKDNDEDHNLNWPETKSSKIPTPYEIFDLEKNAPYSKQRFYELVKKYHPDRSSNRTCDTVKASKPHAIISESTRLERYRLIVAAHTILSDPVKRSAYDRYGTGWNGQPELHSSHAHRDYATSRHSTTHAGDDPMHNATWEDWERWYRQQQQQQQQSTQDHAPQSQVYISNLAFVTLLVMLAGLGGVGQATRAEGFSQTFLEQRDRRHDAASRELMRARQETREKMKDARIDRFLEERDPGWHEREDEYRRLLPQPAEICASEHVKDRARGIVRMAPAPTGREEAKGEAVGEG